MSNNTPNHENRQTRKALFESLGVCVVDFRCCVDVEALGKEEPNPTHSIVFVRRGVFARSDYQGSLVADANQVLFFNKDQPYRYAHPLPGGDDCTILTLDEECARAAVERFAQAPPSGSGGPFSVGCALATPRAVRLHHELLVMLCSGGSTPELATQDAIAELIDETMTALHNAPVASADRPSAGTARRRETVEAVKLILSRSIETPPSLGELAATLNCSPFQLSRIFRSTTGLPLRRYVRRLRTALAADRLRRGEEDLTSLALDLGFYDHSHFTNSFSREWGVPPSSIRPSDATEERRVSVRRSAGARTYAGNSHRRK